MNQLEIGLAVFYSICFAIVFSGGIALVIVTAFRARIQNRLLVAVAQTRYEQELRTIATEVQDHLFDNLALELHNNIGQRLTLVHMQLQSCESKLADPGTLIKSADLNLVETMKQLRTLSHGLNSEHIKTQHLVAILKSEIGRMNENGRMAVCFEGDEIEPEISADQKLITYRIFQEVISNALKHSLATSLNISMHADPGFVLEVEDNGKGFNTVEMMLLQARDYF